MASHRKVSVNWLAKAVAFNIFDKIPFGEKIYYKFQRDVTRTLPRTLSPTSKTASAQIAHAKAIVARRQDIDKITLLEIGAGWDLYANLIYFCYGINRQIAIDIRRWARAETVNAVIRHLQVDAPPGCLRVPQRLVTEANFATDLSEFYGISYNAPADATKTGLAAGSVDVITTTSVFEHVPQSVCAAIVAECRRVIAPDGMMRHTIDYSDHYAHADPSITSYNYLRFGQSAWALFNPGIHYQNRLRTPDFKEMFKNAGFTMVDIVEWLGESQEFDKIKVHHVFSKYSEGDLRVNGAHFVLQPA